MKSSLPPPDVSFKALLRLAGPIYVANLAIIGSGTIDTIMAGQLGKDHLAAIALGIASTISVLMGLVGILQGLSPIAGHHFGAQRYGRIGEELVQNFWLAGLLSLIGVPILLCTDFWISLGQVKGEVARMTAQYMFWTAMALPFSMGARSFISLNAAVSRPRVTMWVSLGMLALKAPLNAIFMYGWFGFPALGGGGAGISFFTLSVLAFFTYLIIWKRDPFYKRMHVDRITPPIWSFLKEQLRVGVPIGLCTFFEVSSFTLMAIFVSRFGSEIISAHQIVANLTSMCYMIPLSIGIATSVLISQCLGARWPGIAFLVLPRVVVGECGGNAVGQPDVRGRHPLVLRPHTVYSVHPGVGLRGSTHRVGRCRGAVWCRGNVALPFLFGAFPPHLPPAAGVGFLLRLFPAFHGCRHFVGRGAGARAA